MPRLLAVTLVLVAAASAAGEPGRKGPGGASCAGYLSLFDSLVPTGDFLAWTQGYLAAASIAYRRNIELDSADAETWLVKYCRAHPEHSFGYAVLELTRAHAD